ncbi:MAG: 1-deoxy-D-xylulose-5-phosphate reductoisomerase, partial [Clostridiales bacterium]
MEVCDWYPQLLQPVVLTAGCDWQSLAALTRKYHPRLIAIGDQNAYGDLKRSLADMRVEILVGREGLNAAAAYGGGDMAVVAIAGVAGLEPTLAAIQAGKDIALANKETLVAAG